eukprot:c41048_g1_i1 orf=3-266(-)
MHVYVSAVCHMLIGEQCKSLSASLLSCSCFFYPCTLFPITRGGQQAHTDRERCNTHAHTTQPSPLLDTLSCCGLQHTPTPHFSLSLSH